MTLLWLAIGFGVGIVFAFGIFAFVLIATDGRVKERP